MRVKTANASQNGQMRVKTAKCEMKPQNARQWKMRVEMAKRESNGKTRAKRQNAGRKGKMQVETAKRKSKRQKTS